MLEELNNGGNPEPGSHSSDLLFPMPSKEDIKKNGLYYYVLSEQERVFLQMARNSEGLQEEIDLLQAKIQYIAFVYPANFGLLLRALSLMERLRKTQHTVFKKNDDSRMEQCLEKVFTKLQLPLGLLHDGLGESPAQP